MTVERIKIHIEQTTSTNTALKEWIQDSGSSDRLCLYADHQTQGRGQRGNRWESVPGQNVLCSLVLHRPAHLIQANLAAMWSVHRSLEDHGVLDSRIKWPNDLLVQDRKVAGILVENALEGSRIRHAVAGIGLNVNQVEFPWPNVASMRMFTGKNYDLDLILNSLYDAFYAAVDLPFEQLLRLCNTILLGKGEYMEFSVGGRTEILAVEAIDASGGLRIRDASGTRIVHHPHHRLAL